MEKEVETVFVVSVHTDGTFSASLVQPETPIEVKREATAYDVYNTSREIIKEIDLQQQTERIIVSLLSVLQGPPAEPTPAEAVADALKERGIKPETAA